MFVKKRPALEQVIDDSRQAIVDEAENQLSRLVGEGYFPAVRFALETIGKDRGYSERVELHATTTLELVEVIVEATPPKQIDAIDQPALPPPIQENNDTTTILSDTHTTECHTTTPHLARR
jgi:hypothetical protein